MACLKKQKQKHWNWNTQWRRTITILIYVYKYFKKKEIISVKQILQQVICGMSQF